MAETQHPLCSSLEGAAPGEMSSETQQRQVFLQPRDEPKDGKVGGGGHPHPDLFQPSSMSKVGSHEVKGPALMFPEIGT